MKYEPITKQKYLSLKNNSGKYKILDETSGRQEWRQNGNLHREDGPAVIDNIGKMWFQHGLMHREDGPAIIGEDKSRLWLLKNQLLAEADWKSKICS